MMKMWIACMTLVLLAVSMNPTWGGGVSDVGAARARFANAKQSECYTLADSKDQLEKALKQPMGQRNRLCGIRLDDKGITSVKLVNFQLFLAGEKVPVLTLRTNLEKSQVSRSKDRKWVYFAHTYSAQNQLGLDGLKILFRGKINVTTKAESGRVKILGENFYYRK